MLPLILLAVGLLLLVIAIVAIFGLVGMGISVILWMLFFIIVGVGVIEFILGGLPQIELALQMLWI